MGGRFKCMEAHAVEMKISVKGKRDLEEKQLMHAIGRYLCDCDTYEAIYKSTPDMLRSSLPFDTHEFNSVYVPARNDDTLMDLLVRQKTKLLLLGG